MSVFMVLATLAVFAGYGWGQLFQLSAFNITLAAVVFVMALSFLGVWEIPDPRFCRRGQGRRVGAEGRRGRRVFQGCVDHDPGHAMHCTVPRPGIDLGRGPTGRGHLRLSSPRLAWAWPARTC